MAGENIVRQSAVLRGQGKLIEAIKVIEDNLKLIDSDVRPVAYLAAFGAAHENGNVSLAKKYAWLVAIDDPDLPSIQNYLKR